jgi:hypothetical protein
VVYSEAARAALQQLAAQAAQQRGQGAAFVAALKEIDRRLHIYPPFGDPLIDLKVEPGQVWVGTVPPLVVRYAIFEDRRLVVVAAPPAVLPTTGL